LRHEGSLSRRGTRVICASHREHHLLVPRPRLFQQRGGICVDYRHSTHAGIVAQVDEDWKDRLKCQTGTPSNLIPSGGTVGHVSSKTFNVGDTPPWTGR